MAAAHVISQVEVPQETTIDREKICPLLLRIFCANSRHNPLAEYARGSVPPNELQVYTWMDCNLRELMSLIKDVNMESRRRGTEFSFAIVSPDRYTPRYVMREIGLTVNGQRGVDDNKTLAQCKFEVGDYIDVAITLPRMDAGPGGRFNGPPRGGRMGDRFSGGDRFGTGDRFGGGGGDRFGNDRGGGGPVRSGRAREYRD
ncbi:putative Sin3 associated polypeptide p18 [Aphelenchoides avenae]|nr:putative Sin3 associated polypeptide p18 [Aphelenchus avenae]